GLEHVIDQLPDLRRDLVDRLGHEPEPLVRQDDDFLESHERRFRHFARSGQCAEKPVNASLTTKFKTALTIKIYAVLTINVPSSFPRTRESGREDGMNQTLFMIGDWPVHAGDALIGFGALVLILLLAIVIVVARSGRRGADFASLQAVRADEFEERL